MAATLLSGVVFGAALTASGVHQPSVILGQLKLVDWDMLETFLTATASSTFVPLPRTRSPRPEAISRGPLG
jgi:hypothetical protein